MKEQPGLSLCSPGTMHHARWDLSDSGFFPEKQWAGFDLVSPFSEHGVGVVEPEERRSSWTGGTEPRNPLGWSQSNQDRAERGSGGQHTPKRYRRSPPAPLAPYLSLSSGFSCLCSLQGLCLVFPAPWEIREGELRGTGRRKLETIPAQGFGRRMLVWTFSGQEGGGVPKEGHGQQEVTTGIPPGAPTRPSTPLLWWGQQQRGRRLLASRMAGTHRAGEGDVGHRDSLWGSAPTSWQGSPSHWSQPSPVLSLLWASVSIPRPD